MVCTLKGHQDRITGLAFSKLLGVLVSLGADAQVYCKPMISHVQTYIYGYVVMDCKRLFQIHCFSVTSCVCGERIGGQDDN